MSSDFSDNSRPCWELEENQSHQGETAHLSLGKNILKLAFPQGFVAWRDRCEAQTPPSSLWVSTAVHILNMPHPPEFVKLCHLLATVFILVVSSLASSFRYSLFTSTPARSIPHITPMGMTILIMFSCHALLFLMSLFPSLTFMPFSLFSLLPRHHPITSQLRTPGFWKTKT